MNILIVSGHPDLNSSLANAIIISELEKHFPEARVRKLGELYGRTYQIDVEAEQEALLWADLIVWQFPFYWYSIPALMKKWLDDVFLYGFSHGSKGRLGGKKFFISFTTGGPAAAFSGEEGSFGDLKQLTSVFESIAKKCKLDYQGYMCLNGVSTNFRTTPEQIEDHKARTKDYAVQLIARIEELAKK